MLYRLVDCKEGSLVRLIEIDAGQKAILNLIHLGLNLGDTIKIRRKSSLRGPVAVSHNGTDIAIGFGLAQKILVKKL